MLPQFYQWQRPHFQNFNRKSRKFIKKDLVETSKSERKEENFCQRIRAPKNGRFFVLRLSEHSIMHTEEFILIQKRMFITKQPVRSEILENSFYGNKAAQLTLMQRDTPTT